MQDVTIRWDVVRASGCWEHLPELHPWENVDYIAEVLGGADLDGTYTVRLSDGEVSEVFYFYPSELEIV